MAAEVRIFGIRHHGPGCARALCRALEEWEPDCLLLEGPPEGEGLFAFAREGMEPPVALLLYARDDPGRAAFYPYAAFSPEWQAVQYAVRKGIPLHCMDLPFAQLLALEKSWEEEDARAGAEGGGDATPDADPDVDADAAPDADAGDSVADAEDGSVCGAADPLPAPENGDDAEELLRLDPFQTLGRLAGYEDGEAWWSALVEERRDGTDLFEAVALMMRELREQTPPAQGRRAQREALREAAMRACLRRARKEAHERIAVICGAWHVPALENMPPAKEDAALLKGLPREKVDATWSLWSYVNLAVEDGYAAGVASPAWYEFLWRYGTSPDRTARWLHRAARLLREEGLDCSPAHLIESVRLAEGLAGLRGRSLPGLAELHEALSATVCMGDDLALQLVRRKLFVGEAVGTLPPDAPAAPLQRDIDREGRRLRIPFTAEEKSLVLDLRKPLDAERSVFLHRLDLLEIGFCAVDTVRGRSTGTFREAWRLCWTPDVALAVVRAGRRGKDVPQALASLLAERAAEAEPADIARLFEKTLYVNLPDLLPPLLRTLEDKSAQSRDCRQLLAAVPPLVDVLRYGGVRQFDRGMVESVLAGLLPRCLPSLPWACANIQTEPARTLGGVIVEAHTALRLLDTGDYFESWLATLLRLVQWRAVHPLLRGLSVRLLLDARRMSAEDVARELACALSLGEEAEHGADWLTGFLENNTLILLHDAVLWQVVDSWLVGLSEDAFLHAAPLLRRIFADAPRAERRALGERAGREAEAADAAVDAAAEAVAPVAVPQAEEAVPAVSGALSPLFRRILGLQEVSQ